MTIKFTERKLEQVGEGLVVIVGGSGISDNPLFGGNKWYRFDTGYKITFPDGESTSGKVLAQIDEKKGLIFIPRHGIVGIENYGPSRTQYGANDITAAILGATCMVGISATGTFRGDIPIASVVIPSDYYDESLRDPNLFGINFVVHSHPKPAFSEGLRRILLETALDPPSRFCGYRKGSSKICSNGIIHYVPEKSGRSQFAGVVNGGKYVCIPGDRFGTHVEGYRRSYADIVGMTLCPEADFATQTDIQYAVVAVPVDQDFDANHKKTRAVMRSLSRKDYLPMFVASVVERLSEFAKKPVKLKQLKGNIINGGTGRIRNEYLSQIADRIAGKYCFARRE